MRAIDMRLNLNDEIKVKLTEHGKDIYYHQYDRLNTEFGREVCKPKYPKVDENGYTTFQLWCFMELYGVHMGMTLPNVIEPLDIVFDAPTIETERKTGEWISDGPSYRGGYDWMHCSECGHKEIDCPAGRTNYCPNCGAKMKWKGDDNETNNI